jgi:membrane-bound ClpP family serine protease
VATRYGETNQDMVGTVGHVTVPVSPARPGEVLLPVRGGTEAFAAFSDEPIAKHARIVVVECRSARSVTVTPC